jgi:hypothetical protein
MAGCGSWRPSRWSWNTRRSASGRSILRRPASVTAEAERIAAAEGTSLNQFVATAVAEKLAALRTAAFFAERRARADWAAFDRLMARRGGEAPGPGDEAE